MKKPQCRFFFKKILFREKKIKAQLWDTSGNEKYKNLITNYIRYSNIVFIVYNVSNRSSYENVHKWINFVNTIDSKTIIILVGNKIDLEREVKKKEVQELAKNEGI